VISRPEVAEGIALFPSISDESLMGMLHMQKKSSSQSGYEENITGKKRALFSETEVPSVPSSEEEGEQSDLFKEYYRGRTIKDIAMILSDSVQDIFSRQGGYFNIITLVNSSCVGKTRAILEYAKTHRVVYFLCKDVFHGLKMPTIFSKMLERWMKEEADGARESVADKILDCLFEAAKNFPDATDLNNAQFQDCKLGGQYHTHLTSLWTKAQTPDVATTQNRLKGVQNLKAVDEKDLLVLACDEADGLFHVSDEGNHSKEQSAFRCFLRRINKRKNMIAILSSTSSDVAKLYPGHYGSNDRGSGRIDYPPVYNIVNVNLSPSFPLDYHLFQYGRGIFRNYSEDMNEVVAFAARKLTNNLYATLENAPGDYRIEFRRSLNREVIKVKQAHLALFYCRFGMSNISYMAKELVSNNMAVLVKLEPREGKLKGLCESYCECKYLSEPALCEASARITETSNDVQLSVVDEVTIAISSNKPIVASLGDCGEMALAAAIAYVKDRCLRNELRWYDANQADANLSSPLSFVTLLRGLKDEEMVDKVVVDYPDLKNMTVSFTRFLRYPILTDMMMKAAYDRCFAFYAPENCTGFDKYIPIRHAQSDNTYTDIGWFLQDKNYSSRLSEAATKDILNDIYQPVIPSESAAASFSVCCLCTTGGGAHDICEVVEIDSGVFQLRFTLDLDKDFALLDRDVKNALYKLARPGAHDHTIAAMDEATIFSGIYDVVYYDKSDKAAVLKRLGSMKKMDLVKVCRNFGLNGFSKLKKAELVEYVKSHLRSS